jgi:hypothetical protein
VGPRAGLNVCENLAPTGIRSPGGPARSQSPYRLSYAAHIHVFLTTLIVKSSNVEDLVALSFMFAAVVV